MALFRSYLHKVLVLYSENGVDGGTYYLNGIAVCMQPLGDKRISSNEYCSRPAGYSTDHLGEGRCRMHSLPNVADMATMGRYDSVAVGDMRMAYEAFVTDPRLLDIAPELALQRSLLAKLWNDYIDTPDTTDVRAVLNVIRDITDSVAKMEKIQSQHVITAAMARFVISKALDVARRFLPPNRMEEFVGAWRSEVEGTMLTVATKVL